MSMNLQAFIPGVSRSDLMDNFGMLEPAMRQTSTEETYAIMRLPPHERLAAYLKTCEHCDWYDSHRREMERWETYARLCGRRLEFRIE